MKRGRPVVRLERSVVLALKERLDTSDLLFSMFLERSTADAGGVAERDAYLATFG